MKYDGLFNLFFFFGINAFVQLGVLMPAMILPRPICEIKLTYIAVFHASALA